MTRPHLTIDPAVRCGAPNVRGISAEAIADMVTAGESLDRVAADYDLTRHEVLLACWWEGLHERPEWRDWAAGIGQRMWHTKTFDPDAEQGPPT